MNEAKITIITPTYNRAHTLPRVYESLKNQTFKDFIWLIMDDGSTDNTKDLVKKFHSENGLNLQYHYHSNQHKFVTVFKGVEKVETPYFMVVDSDDSYPANSLELLYKEVSAVKNQDQYISVMGLSQYPNGEIVGHPYPGSGFDGSILEMRYRYKVRGDKFGIFITKTYQNLLKEFDYSPYLGKGYIPQSVFFNTYDAAGYKTRFVNKVVRTYHFDQDDASSVSNTRWTGKNTFGLMEGYLSFVNSYRSRLLRYPKALVRNLVGYQVYAMGNGIGFSDMQKKLKAFKGLAFVFYPLSYLYYRKNKP